MGFAGVHLVLSPSGEAGGGFLPGAVYAVLLRGTAGGGSAFGQAGLEVVINTPPSGGGLTLCKVTLCCREREAVRLHSVLLTPPCSARNDPGGM